MSDIRLAPKEKQPKDGYKHPKHLLAYGPPHRAYSRMREMETGDGWYETNEYCISPSPKLYDPKFLNE